MVRLRPHAIVLHPLPRVDEISPDVDNDPRAAYFPQARIGLFVRMALLKTLLAGELSSARGVRDRITIVEAPDTIEMSEKPTSALRKKPNSSMVVGLRMQVEEASDAFVSAGNTGAQMATSAMLLKLQPGLTRPAIAT